MSPELKRNNDCEKLSLVHWAISLTVVEAVREESDGSPLVRNRFLLKRCTSSEIRSICDHKKWSICVRMHKNRRVYDSLFELVKSCLLSVTPSPRSA